MSGQVAGLGAAGLWNPGAEGAGEAGEAARGEWNGLAVQAADDPSSLLADAMEEMTFAAEEKVEKDVSERKTEAKRERSPIRVVPPAEAMAQLQQQMAERLAKLLRAARAAAGDPAKFKEALAEFGDPTERHAAMAWLEDQSAGEPALREMAAGERRRLEAEEARAVQAGYNLEAAGAGGDEGRAAYRRTVLGHAHIGAVLEDVLARSGADDFSGTVEHLRRAVSADLSAAHPSTDKRELESLNNDLYHLRALANFTREFGEGLARLRAAGGKPPLAQAGLETMRLLCRAKEERLVALDGLKAILRLEGAGDPVYDAQALSRTQRLAHQLPPKLFADEDARQRLLAAGQKLLDAAVDREEAATAGER